MNSNPTLFDIFVDGARKGWQLGVNSIVPNVLMAFVLIQALQVTGLLKLLGTIFGPVMAVFGVPGEAVAVLVATWMSMGGGAGVAFSLYSAGVLNGTHVTILAPAIMLMGAQIQYMGRWLGTAGVQTRFYPILFAISIINALLSMIVMRFLA